MTAYSLSTKHGGIRAQHGFTLVEMAVVLAIVGVLIGSMMLTLSAQVDQRNFNETQRRLESAREAILAFAIVNGRLPCPSGAPTGGANDGLESPAGGTCNNYFNGYLPGRTLAIQPSDSSGYAVDAWGNRLRYVVSNGSSPHFTDSVTLRTNGISTQPTTLKVCTTSTGILASACASNATYEIESSVSIAAIVYSVGKNGALTAAGADELANQNNDAVFVSHTPTPSTATNGEFDDMFVWITTGTLYGRLISAGLLP